jgi:hypothetical protein
MKKRPHRHSYYFEIELIHQAELHRAQATGDLFINVIRSLKSLGGVLSRLIDKATEWPRKSHTA